MITTFTLGFDDHTICLQIQNIFNRNIWFTCTDMVTTFILRFDDNTICLQLLEPLETSLLLFIWLIASLSTIHGMDSEVLLLRWVTFYFELSSLRTSMEKRICIVLLSTADEDSIFQLFDLLSPWNNLSHYALCFGLSLWSYECYLPFISWLTSACIKMSFFHS